MLISAFWCLDHREHVVKKLRSNNESVYTRTQHNIFPSTMSYYQHAVKQFKSQASLLKPEAKCVLFYSSSLWVYIVMASVIDLTSARYMPQGYNARAPARSMEANQGIT